MSTYVREKVLRVPLDRYVDFSTVDYEDFRDELEAKHKDLIDYGTVGKFQFAPTEGLYFDFMLEKEYDACDGDWGKTRALYPTEAAKYFSTFEKIFPNINMADVRLVEFCWYNGCEADDYYDEVNDPFYKEV